MECSKREAMCVRVYVGASEEHGDVSFTVCGPVCVYAPGIRQPAVRLLRAFRALFRRAQAPQ